MSTILNFINHHIIIFICWINNKKNKTCNRILVKKERNKTKKTIKTKKENIGKLKKGLGLKERVVLFFSVEQRRYLPCVLPLIHSDSPSPLHRLSSSSSYFSNDLAQKLVGVPLAVLQWTMTWTTNKLLQELRFVPVIWFLFSSFSTISKFVLSFGRLLLMSEVVVMSRMMMKSGIVKIGTDWWRRSVRNADV